MKQLSRQLIKSQVGIWVPVTIAAGAIELDLRKGNFFDVDLTANITAITIVGQAATGYSHVFYVRFRQTTISAFTVTGWPAAVSWLWHGGAVPAVDPVQGAQDEFKLETRDGGTTYLGALVVSNNKAARRHRAFLGAAWAADKVPYFSGAEAVALADFPTFGRALVSQAEARLAAKELGVWHVLGASGAAVSHTGTTTETTLATVSVPAGATSSFSGTRVDSRTFSGAASASSNVVGVGIHGRTFSEIAAATSNVTGAGVGGGPTPPTPQIVPPMVGGFF